MNSWVVKPKIRYLNAIVPNVLREPEREKFCRVARSEESWPHIVTPIKEPCSTLFPTRCYIYPNTGKFESSLWSTTRTLIPPYRPRLTQQSLPYRGVCVLSSTPRSLFPQCSSHRGVLPSCRSHRGVRLQAVPNASEYDSTLPPTLGSHNFKIYLWISSQIKDHTCVQKNISVCVRGLGGLDL